MNLHFYRCTITINKKLLVLTMNVMLLSFFGKANSNCDILPFIEQITFDTAVIFMEIASNTSKKIFLYVNEP